MKSYESELFGSIQQPESFRELMELITSEEPETGRVRMWRGQADITWRLDSSAFRRLLASGEVKYDSPSDKAESKIISYEEYLLEKAECHGFRHVEGRTLSDFELLARLRHYGAATRFVDCSRNALIAVWFAASQNPTEHGALFGIHCHYIGRSETEIETQPYKKVVDDLGEYDYPMTWAPFGLTPRTSVQHSQFLYSAVSNKARGSIQIAQDEGAFLAVAISPELKPKLTEILKESFDIYHFSLFPDVEGFSAGNAEHAERWVMERW